MQLDPQLVQASLLIRNMPELQPFVEWLRVGYQTELVICSTMPADKVGSYQGRAQQIKKILDQIDGAPAQADQIRGRQ